MSAADGNTMRPHIATIRNQPRGLLKGPLALQQRLPDLRYCRHGRGPAPVDSLRTSRVTSSSSSQYALDPSSLLSNRTFSSRATRLRARIAKLHALFRSRNGRQSIQRPAVQQVEAQRLGNPPCDGPLSGPTGPIDRNYRDMLTVMSPLRRECCTPIAAMQLAKTRERCINGGHIFNHNRTGATLPAMASDMAIRWSPMLCTVPPRKSTAVHHCAVCRLVDLNTESSHAFGHRGNTITFFHPKLTDSGKLVLPCRGRRCNEQHRKFINRQRHQRRINSIHRAAPTSAPEYRRPALRPAVCGFSRRISAPMPAEYR